MPQGQFSDALSVGRAEIRAAPNVRDAIAHAAEATGVDFNYLLAQAKLESSLDPTARAGTSSAAGLYQFTGGTWLATLDRHGAEHGFDWAKSAIDGGQVGDPATRAQIMALRFDPNASALMAAELANDNRQSLTSTLGREPDATELYLAHFLGSDGASRFLTALQADPGTSAVALLPKAAAANRTIFFDNGAPRSVGAVMELMRGKVSGAMEGGINARGTLAVQDMAPATAASQEGSIARQFHAVSAASPMASGASMAETLRHTFALGNGAGQGSTPDFVRTAYGKLQAFGL